MQKINFLSIGNTFKYLSLDKYNYINLIIFVLKNNKNSTFVHIGNLNYIVILIIKIRIFLELKNKKRFKYINSVKNLNRFINQNQINFYIPSYPIGSGLTYNEISHSKIKILNRKCRFTVLSGEYEFKDHYSWSNFNELQDIITKNCKNKTYENKPIKPYPLKIHILPFRIIFFLHKIIIGILRIF